MLKLLLPLFITTFLFSVNIINHKIYTKENSVELHFFLDDPFLSEAHFSKDNKISYIQIPSINITSPKEILKESNLLMFGRVFPSDEGILIKIKEKTPITIELLKSTDLYSIKLIIKKKNGYKLNTMQTSSISFGSDVVDMEKNYYIVGMFLGVIFLIFILAKLFANRSGGEFFIKNGDSKISVKVQTQKILDNQNKIVLLTIGNMNYLILVGSNNMLIDKYKTGKKSLAKESFDSKIRKHTDKIDSLIK